MEQTLSKDVQERLDMINWDNLKDKYGISRDTFYNNPHLFLTGQINQSKVTLD